MSVTLVSRWKGEGDHGALLKKEVPLLKKHGAISIKAGRCFSGSYAGELVCSAAFPDWVTYAKAIEALITDADYMKAWGEFTAKFELADRALIVGEEYL